MADMTRLFNLPEATESYADDWVFINQDENGGSDVKMRKSMLLSGGAGTPGGLTTQVQFNDGGVFGGHSGLTYDKTTGTLTATILNSPTIDGLQPLNSNLTAFSGLTSATDKLPYFTGSGTASVTDFSSFGRTLVDDADASTARTTLGVAIGTNVQAHDPTLDALASFNTNGIMVQTAADTFTARTLTGTASRISVTNGNGVSGDPTVDIDSSYAGQASINTLGTVTTGTWQATIIDPAYLGTGTSITTKFLRGDGTWQTVSGGSGTPGGNDTEVQFNDGGSFGGDPGMTYNKTTNALTITGAFSASNVSGTNTGDQDLSGYQPLDADLTAIAGLTSAADRLPYFTGSATAALATFTSYGRTLAALADASAGRTALGVVIGTDVQAHDSTLDAFAGFNSNGLLTQVAPDTFVARAITGTLNRITVTNGNGTSGSPTVDISSSYVGQNTITTLGTITTGTWTATAIGPTYGGTGLTSYAAGDILYASASNTLSKLAVPALTDNKILELVSGFPAWKNKAAQLPTNNLNLYIPLAMPGAFYGTTVNSTQTVANDATQFAGNMIFMPFFVTNDYTPAGIYFYCKTGVAASSVTICLYADASGPSGSAQNIVNLSTATSGFKSAAWTPSLEGNKIYWLSVQCSTSTTLALQAMPLSTLNLGVQSQINNATTSAIIALLSQTATFSTSSRPSASPNNQLGITNWPLIGML